jgi:cytochrome c556
VKRMIAIVTATIMGASAAFAVSAAIAERQKLMDNNGDATKVVFPMLKGAAPFDLAKVQAALNTYIASAKGMPALFPDDSKTGGKTGALPAIWENKADFDANFAKFDADATAALASIKDEASFKANFPAILKDCGGCHQTYRAKT